MEQKFQDAMHKLKEITTAALPKATLAIFLPCQGNGNSMFPLRSCHE